MMKRLLLAVSLFTVASPASAATLVNVSFTGSFTGKLLTSLVTKGTTFTGTFSYDADSSPVSTGLLGATYELSSPASITIGSNNYQGTLSGTVIRSIVDGTIFRFQLPGSQTFALSYLSLGSGSGNFGLPNQASFYNSPAVATLTTSPFRGNFGFANATATISAVPEPSTWAMFIAGFAAVGGLLRRGRRPATRRVAID